ncbi:MAG: acyl-CoA synthetase, AMP-forming [Candidatus Eremiobacteraeota bacterium]|nr:acyl-CoA synthetase, AMP-forming [Candidatus Eremiobacteraeota bacterium]
MNIAWQLEARVDATPNACAIVDDRTERRCTYTDLRDRAAALAEDLRRAGLRPGHRVLIAVPMSLDLYIALIAVWRCGLVAVVPDASTGLAGLNRCIEAVRPAALIAAQRLAALAFIVPAARTIRRKFVFGWFPGMGSVGAPSTGSVPVAIEAREPGDPALITFTSGSTGAPKVAVRSHGVLDAQMKAILANVHLGTTTLETMPIVLLANLAAGGTSVIPDVNLRSVGKADAGALAAAISRHGCTTLIGSPAVLQRLAEGCDEADTRLNGLNEAYSGGAPVFPVILEAFERVAHRARTHAIYGSTEAEPIAHIAHLQITPNDIDLMRQGHGLLVGRPDVSTDVAVIASQWGHPLGPLTSAEFAARRVAENVAGEIVVAGAHVLPGYLNGVGDEDTKIHVADGVFHRTGDLGRLDAGGRLWLLGRAGAAITDERGTVYPLAVECAASFIAGIRRSALVRSHASRVLFVEGDGVNVPDLRTRLSWAMIDEVVPIETIPVDRRHNAKVDYPRLQLLASRRR